MRMLMVASALMMAHQVAGKASRDAIFLSQFRTADLPAMVTVGGDCCHSDKRRGQPHVCAVGPAPARARVVRTERRASNCRVVPSGPLGRASGRCVIYLHVVAFGALLLSSFWSLMNESFEPRSAKAVIRKDQRRRARSADYVADCSPSVWPHGSGRRDVILLLAALHLACAGLLWGVVRGTGPPLAGSPARAEPYRRRAAVSIPARVSRSCNHYIRRNRPARFRIQGRGGPNDRGVARRCCVSSPSTTLQRAC